MEARPHHAGGPVHDRSARLSAFGALSLLLGAASVLLGLAHAVLPLVAGESGAALGLPPDPRPYAMGLLLFASIGAVFVVLGTGSMRRRRWAPPLMRIVARLWILGGLTLLVFLPSMLDGVLSGALGGLAVDGGVLLAARLAVLGGTAVLGVLLPALFVWAYRDPHVTATCRAHDPVERWTERCPQRVLGLSVGLAACAVFLVPLAVRPAVPWFGWLVAGWPGALLTLGTAAACAWLARAVLALRSSSWWLATTFVAGLGASVLLTLARLEPAEIYRGLGYTDRELALLEGSAALDRSLHAWLTAGLTVAALAYMVAIRGSFRRDPAPK
jgi:hypothetical protein